MRRGERWVTGGGPIVRVFSSPWGGGRGGEREARRLPWIMPPCSQDGIISRSGTGDPIRCIDATIPQGFSMGLRKIRPVERNQGVYACVWECWISPRMRIQILCGSRSRKTRRGSGCNVRFPRAPEAWQELSRFRHLHALQNT